MRYDHLAVPEDFTTEQRREAIYARMEFRKALSANGMCGICAEDVESYEQVGRCVYADPCGHRQGQGRAPDRPVR